MELGRHIAAELRLNARQDWLRHWLAHHVAELVTEAETAEDVDTRREAEKQATEAILKIWEHRKSLPGQVNPLAHCRETLQVLNELRSSSELQSFPYDRAGGSVVGSLYKRFPRLIEALALLSIVRKKQHRRKSEAARKFLQSDEETLLSALERRVKVIGEDVDEPTSGQLKDDYQKFEEVVHEMVRQTIADLKSALEPDAKKIHRSSPPRPRG